MIVYKTKECLIKMYLIGKKQELVQTSATAIHLQVTVGRAEPYKQHVARSIQHEACSYGDINERCWCVEIDMEGVFLYHFYKLKKKKNLKLHKIYFFC